MSIAIAHIRVKTLDGKPVDLIEIYKGNILLLIIYNNDCLGCTGRALPLAYDFQLKYPNIQVAGLHANFPNREGTKESIKSVFRSGNNPFPIYIDEHHNVYDQVQAQGTPQWLLINKNGILYRSIFGSQDNAANRLYYALESIVAG